MDEFLKRYEFDLDDFQKEAIEHITNGTSVMVAAPTGTGKTVVAEYAVHVDQQQGLRTMYTTPIKALSNQKFRDLREEYGSLVGLMTGDVVENPGGRILVMTTEVLRNMLIQTPWELDNVGHVVFDEIHYLADTERGTTWEEGIICCPKHVRLICLSATIANADEIAAWISKTHRPIELIKHFERAVPLRHYYFLDDHLHTVVESDGRQVAHFAGIGGEARRARFGRWRGNQNSMPRGSKKPRHEPEPKEIVEMLSRRDMLPAIYFLFSRRDTEESAASCLPVRLRASLDPQVRQEVDDILDAYLGRLPTEDRNLGQVQMVSSLVRRGLGFHHAGLLPILKQLIEELFNKGLMDVVFATDTLALGINMPARSVVVGRMSKFDGETRRLLFPNEYLQIAGRAGRRGIDVKGHVVVPYSPWVPFEDVVGVATGEMRPIDSAFSTRYNSVLNLWDPPAGDRVLHLMSNSLLEFQLAIHLREIEKQIDSHDGQIRRLSKGCLTGLEADLTDYQNLVRTRVHARNEARKASQAEERASESLDERPWNKIDRRSLNARFRSFTGGEMVYSDQLGWGVYVGKNGPSSGIGYFIFGESVQPVFEYGLIDYLPAGSPKLELPETLRVANSPVGELAEILNPGEYDGLRDQFKSLDLPDMAAWIESHRREKQAATAALIQLAAERTQQAAENLRSMDQAIEKHPCHQCVRQMEHRKSLRVVETLIRKRDESRQQHERLLEVQKTRMTRTLQGIANVLERFGYLKAGHPTPKAQSLRDIFDTNALLICEMLEQGLLSHSSPADIAEVFSWFAYDRDLEFANGFLLSGKAKSIRSRLDGIQKKIFSAEEENGLRISTGYNVYFYGVAHAWCRGSTFEKILEKVDLSEGDVMMSFNKTLDIMRQVRDMLAKSRLEESCRPENHLLPKLVAAEKLMRRGIVEQSYAIITQPPEEEEDQELPAAEPMLARAE